MLLRRRFAFRFSYPSALTMAAFVITFGALVGRGAFADEKQGKTTSAPPVSVADVTVSASNAHLEKVSELARKEAEAALVDLAWGKAKSKRRYFISLTVQELGSSPTGARSARSSCKVSATVHDSERGQLLGTLQGKAGAEDTTTAVLDTERAVLSAALRSALSKVPEVIAAAP